MSTINSAGDISGISASLQPFFPRSFYNEQITRASAAVELASGGDKPSKKRLSALAEYLNKLDQPYQIQGVDFSRAQIDLLIRARNAGRPIEF